MTWIVPALLTVTAQTSFRLKTPIGTLGLQMAWYVLMTALQSGRLAADGVTRGVFLSTGRARGRPTGSALRTVDGPHRVLVCL